MSIEETIEALRQCNLAQADVIVNMEHYERAISGRLNPVEGEPGGYGNGYTAEIDYLTFRKCALETLISSVERYGRVSGERASSGTGRGTAVTRAA